MVAIPRSTIANRRYRMLDAETLLRDEAVAGPIAATTTETAIGPTKLELFEGFQVAVHASYTSYLAATNFWTVSVEVSDDPSGTFVQVGSLALETKDPADTEYELEAGIPLEGEYIRNSFPGAEVLYIRSVATLTGAAGELSYTAYLTNQHET